jgi:hypothetical protein
LCECSEFRSAILALACSIRKGEIVAFAIAESWTWE